MPFYIFVNRKHFTKFVFHEILFSRNLSDNRPDISIFQIKKLLESFFDNINQCVPLFHMLLTNFARKGVHIKI
jgi:hypothetical protein